MKRAITQIFTLLLLITLAVPAFAGKVLAEIEYFYSDDGTLTGKAFNGKRVNFEYDLRGQLLAIKDASGKDLERYTYDPAGNRLSKTINGLTTTYTYDKANQLVTSTVNEKTTHYKYDAAGRMIQAGDKTYIYNGQNKVSEVRQNGKTIAKFEYNIDGQIAKAIYGDKVEEFMWDGLALIWRSGVTYINEPYVTGGNPVMAGDDVLFNDMLGSTLAVNDKAVEMTSFGETADKNAFFTGKPMIDELGYSFLFRDYNPNQGKWTTTDPLGYPDGWNNLAYCGNRLAIDKLGLLVTATFSITRKSLTIRDNTTGISYTVSAISGNSTLADQWNADIGPLPIGTYAIIENRRNNWWELWYKDGTWDDIATGTSGVTRTQFRLHAGSRSRGCITMTPGSTANNIIAMLQATVTTLLQEAGGPLKKFYGSLKVLE